MIVMELFTKDIMTDSKKKIFFETPFSKLKQFEVK